MRRPDPAQIEAACSVIEPVFLGMPELCSDRLDREFGASILFKDETANPIRCFKGRGTSLFMASRGDEQFVCASAGNFGQGLQWAARSRGGTVTVFAAKNAVRSKIEAMRRLGAEVVLAGDDFDHAKEAAVEHARLTGKRLVEDGAIPEFAEGAGTLALEFTRGGRLFDAVLVPLGNGALASGIGTWLRHAQPDCRVIAVGAENAPAMGRAVQTGRLVECDARTIADGIAVRVPIPYAVECVRAVVDEIVFVSEHCIQRAMTIAEGHLGRTVEPAGAAGLAEIVEDPSRWRGMRLAVPLCGGNIDPKPENSNY